MTPPETLRQKRSIETRRMILDAAYTVFTRDGLASATVDDVLKEAGISKGALYHHFSSKEEVFRSLLHDRIKR